MFRWLIMIVTFAVWLACMTSVYLYSQPKSITEVVPGMRSGLDSLFDEELESSRGWRIYVDPRSASGQVVEPAWDGVSEESLASVGWLKTVNNKRGVGRIEQVTTSELKIPPEARMPLFEAMGRLDYFSRSNISQDTGLEDFNAHITVASSIPGFALEMRMLGVRDREELKVTKLILQGNKKLLDKQEKIPIGPRGMPVLDMMPFQYNPDIKLSNSSWDIAVLDTSTIDTTGTTQPGVKAIKATVTGQKTIQLDNETRPSLVVVAEDGTARAWYGPDGVVLKQVFKVMGTVEVIFVRVDYKKLNEESWKGTAKPSLNHPRRPVKREIPAK